MGPRRLLSGRRRCPRWLAGAAPVGDDGRVLGAVIIAVILVIVIPVSVAMSGAVVAGILGWSLKDTAEATHEGSELIDLNV